MGGMKNPSPLPVSLDKKPPASPPVSMDDKKALPLFPAVVALVSSWALATAFGFTVAATFFLNDDTPCPTATSSQSSWWSRCFDLDDERRHGAALLSGLVRCSAPQAAAAALALLLAGRVRRALAVVTLAFTVTSHTLFAWFGGLIFVATEGDYLGILFVVVAAAYFFVAAVLALFCSLVLLLEGKCSNLADLIRGGNA